MKITIIHGQNHKGSSYHIGRLIADALSCGDEVHEFFLPKALPHFCLGCYSCVENETTCPFYNEKAVIQNAIKESDLLIFTTPVYCMRASAPMKSFLDLFFTNWYAHKPKEYMFSKRALIISTSAGSPGNCAVNDIKTSLTNWGVSNIQTYAVAVQAYSWDTIKPKRKQMILKKIEKLCKAQKKFQRKKNTVSLKTKILFKFFAGMQKADWGASPTEKKYWQDKGWLGKNRPWKA